MPGSQLQKLPVIYLVRHGETEWSVSGRHTGLTDLPLTEQGLENARLIGVKLKQLAPIKVFTSTLRRAVEACELAGFGAEAQKDSDLVEWDYGQYEGRTTKEIRLSNPDWEIFRDGCPGGESPAQIGARAERVVGRLRALPGDALLFSSRHFLAVLAARWLGMEPGSGRFFPLSTASLSALSYEHTISEPVIRLWNDQNHLKT
jgi:probable phosphoglycerate mutase